MKHFSLTLALSVAVAAVFCGCHKEEESLEDNIPKNIELTRAETDCNAMARDFSFSLLEEIEKEHAGESYFFSPLSVEFALGLLASGTEGNTFESICEVLGMKDLNALNSYAATMLKALPKLDKKTTVDIANLALFNTNVETVRSYEKTVEQYYDALVKRMDFGSAKTVDYVNKWASDKTKGTIKKVINQKSLTQRDFFLLANALYFKGLWKNKQLFSKTAKEDFFYEDGEKGAVDMMTTTEPCGYAGYGTFSKLRIPYGNGSFALEIVLPGPSMTVRQIMPDVAEAYAGNIKSLSSGQTKLAKIPKFKNSFNLDLLEPLKGMGVCFGEHDYGKMMTTTAPVAIQAKQYSYIDVNEKGTEVAAVTVIVAGLTASSFPSFEFIADRPFLYMITEQSTGAILFMGKFTGK